MANWNDFISLWDDPNATWNSTAVSQTFSPQVEINLNNVWTNITSYVYYRDHIKITQGQQDETSVVQPGTCQFTLNNNDGRFSPRNPVGAYYGQIGRNTPVRVSIPVTSSYLWVPGLPDPTYTVQTPDSASLSVTGDLDVRIDAQLENWFVTDTSPSGAAQVMILAGKFFATGNQASWFLGVTSSGNLRLGWSPDGTVASGISGTSTVNTPVPGSGRLAVRATLDVNDGSGNHVVTFYTSDSINGTWTQLDQVTVAGTTSIFDSTAPLQIGNLSDLAFDTYGTPPSYGKIFAFEMRNGIAGTVVANPDFTTLNEGDTTLTDGSGNVWSITGQAEILQREFRFFGEVSSWPSTWQTGGFDVYVPITANGIMRRLGQGERPLQSTLLRRIPTYSPLAYWPMEDGSIATQAANQVSGGAAMTVSGVTFAQDSSLPGSAPLPTITSGATISGPVPTPSGSPTAFTVGFLYYIGTGPATQRTFLRFLTSGTGYDWKLESGTGGSTLLILDSDGGTVVNQAIGTGTDIFGQWIQLTIAASVSGGTVTWDVTWTKLNGTAGHISGTYSGSLGHVTKIVDPNGYSSDLSGMAIGHIAVFPTNGTNAYGGAFDGFAGEYALQRTTGLSYEENIQVSGFGQHTGEEQIGPQTRETFLTLCQEAADVDGGILYERRTLTGLGYRDRNTLVNQDAALTLSYTSSALIAPLQPTGDDFLVRNDVTVTRVNGSSANEVDTTSALSTQSPPNGVGEYATEYQLHLYDDTRLDFIAGWKLHLGTWDEERYPVVNVAVHNDTSLVPNVLALGVGDRLTITNPPSWLPPGTIDLLVIGYTEQFDQFLWNISYVCVPYGPYHVAAANDAVYGRADTEGSALATSATSTATSLSISTSSGPVWTTAGDDFPFDVTVAGEQVTLVGAGTVMNGNPLILTGSTGWSSQNCTVTYDTSVVNSVNGAVASLKVVPNGTSASGGVLSSRTATGTITPGNSYTASGWVYSPLGWSDLRTVIDWYDSSGTFLSTGLGSATVVAAGTWTFITQTLVAPASSSSAIVRGRFGGTPASTDVTYWWNLQLGDPSTVSTSSPQSFTVIRSVNGVVKSQTTGADVKLTYPAYVAL